jgi:hypothetical protein
VSVVDQQIASRGEPERWLIDASLARSVPDMLHVFRERACDHPMLSDPLALLDALDVAAVQASVDTDTLVSAVLDLYPYPELPRDIRDRLYELDEEATCAHGHGGVPQPELIENALHALLATARGRSKWRKTLESMLAGVLGAKKGDRAAEQ